MHQIAPFFSGGVPPLNTPFCRSMHSATPKIIKDSWCLSEKVVKNKFKWVWLEEYAEYIDDEGKTISVK